jgi:hypothetical protein
VNLRAVTLRRLLLAVSLPFFAYFAACASDCPGVVVDGVCQDRCHDDACAPGWKCIDNACRAPCSSTASCPATQSCDAWETDYGSKGKFCTGPSAPATGRQGAACTKSTDCATEYGYRCVSKACTLTCDVESQCGAVGSCTGAAKDAEGKAVTVCEKDAFPRGGGQYGTPCPNGDECDDAHDFVCVGAGPGDIDAYCTRRYCEGDTDCPNGSFCASVGAARGEVPCGSDCGLGGTNASGCVPSEQIGPGKHFACGGLSLVVNVCKHRAFCSECQTDADCRGEPNQICASDGSGGKICTVVCDPNVNSCPWGSAASCALWDTALGKPTCAHRFGSCRGTGKGCEPCVEQSDCPNGFCTEAQFTGERYCVDLGDSCSCPDGTQSTCKGGGCPTTPAPGSLTMTCYGGSAFESSALHGKCLGATVEVGTRAAKEGCWPKL